MGVARGDNGLVQVLAQLDDGAVEVFDGFHGIHLTVAHHKLVVAQRLHFQKIVIFGNAQQLFIGLPRHNGAVQLARLARRAEQQPLAVLVQQTAGYARLFEEILRVRRADDAVQIFQPHLILHQNNKVVVFLFQHLFVAAQTRVDVLDRVDVLFFQIRQHHLKDARQRHGIVHGAVVVERRNFQVLVDGIQLIVAQPRKQRLPHGQRVNVGVLVKADARALPCLADKQHIKAVGVVRHQNVVAAEFLEGADGFVRRGGVRHHGIVDARQLHHARRDGLAGVDEGAEFLFLVDLAVFDKHRADFRQALGVRVQTGGLGVEHDKAAVQRHFGTAVQRGDHVIDKIRLAAVNQLEVRVAFVDGIGGQHGFGVALADTVVGNGDGAVSHTVRQPHDLAGIIKAVHRAGLGMQMQLHTLLPLGRGILPLRALYLQDIIGQNDVVMLIFVIHIVAAHDQRGAGLQPLPLGHIGVLVPQNLEVDGAGIVGDGGKINLAAVALDLGGKDIAPDRHLAAVAQIV